MGTTRTNVMITPTPISRQRARSQRGYSLIELGIIVAVIGIILGGIVLPIGRQLNSQIYGRVNDQVVASIDAVLAYAVTNRTPGLNIRYGESRSGTAGRNLGYRITRIPAGRPYLPCPDTTGDGLENRAEINIPASAHPPEFQIPSEDRFLLRDDTAHLDDAFDNADGGTEQLNIGACLQQYGNLPWRTLGLPETDPWGSRLTYIVNPIFSTAGYGFDHASRATSVLPFFEIAFAHPNNYLIAARTASRHLGWAPLIVCKPENTSTACTPTASLDLSTAVPTSATPRLSGADLAYAKYLPPFLLDRVREVADGIPFAIISHGRNKSGGADTLGTCSTTIDLNDVTSPEAVNAVYGQCSTTSRFANFFSENATEPFSYNIALSDSVYNQIHAFARVPIYEWELENPSTYDLQVGTDLIHFDDAVGWLTRRELDERLRQAQVFPLVDIFHGLEAGHAYLFRP